MKKRSLLDLLSPLRPGQRAEPSPPERAPARRGPARRPASGEAVAYLTLRLEMLSGLTLRLRLTRNRRTFVSFKRGTGRILEVRASERFLTADEGVVRALADFIAGREVPRARRIMQEWWASSAGPERGQVRTRPPARTRGEVHDLGAIFAHTNARYFGGGIEATIGWGKAPAQGRRIHIRLGSYDFTTRHITIHPLLDSPEVPEHVVAQTVHHEMLHQIIGVRHQGGRRTIHPPEFRAREREFEHYEVSRDWLKAHLPELLGQKKKGAQRLGRLRRTSSGQ